MDLEYDILYNQSWRYTISVVLAITFILRESLRKGCKETCLLFLMLLYS